MIEGDAAAFYVDFADDAELANRIKVMDWKPVQSAKSVYKAADSHRLIQAGHG